ncbi:GMC family oxidoreductase [Marinomonas balearica]|uniref:Choline dehydrogenase-like flavoprotein n=1 Tax=Marinomonas balearica TaxID=491947 RepID=A0A4R6M963_9GAMM|nr:GMC family oxidoreductase N-terminal domain-containing protein [Marinomonas balearica]TDO97963.1 choline dehydrogenase-like flavoprotein [Marinomonas balearica]
MTHKTFDYIVVGAGSAGSVIASRLSEDPAIRVCLIEAGDKDNSPRIQIPAGTISLYKSKKYSWNYYSAPQKNMNHRVLHCPRGKALGGSSSMNSMIYIRGDAKDYEQWQTSGATGWGWNDVLPFFQKSEKNLLGQSEQFHGTQGELHVDKPNSPNPFSLKFVKAASQALGLSQNSDFNGDTQMGVGLYNVTQKDGFRQSSFKAFVHPIVKQRTNLTVIPNVQVEKVLIENKKAIGVIVRQEDEKTTLIAKQEVVLSAGALGSPFILMKSGIGPKQALEQAGIHVQHELKGVGQNLQDHLDGLVTVRSNATQTLGFSFGSLPQVLTSPFQFLLKRKGWLTTNYVEAGGFASTTNDNRPDIQFHFVPGYRSHRGRLFEWGHGYAIHTCVLRPKSIGHISITKEQNLLLDYNFLSNEDDAKTLIEGIRCARKILSDSEFDGARGKEMLPGEHCQTDEQLMDYVKEYGATVFHPVGTCKMGTDTQSVVKPDLSVHGITGLRVADASIMPTLISGNTNAVCIMIGERAADFIKKTQESYTKRQIDGNPADDKHAH